MKLMRPSASQSPKTPVKMPVFQLNGRAAAPAEPFPLFYNNDTVSKKRGAAQGENSKKFGEKFGGGISYRLQVTGYRWQVESATLNAQRSI